MIQTIKQNKKAVLAFLLALVMLIGLIPFTATEAHAMTIDATSGEVVWEAGDSFTLYLVNKDDPTKTETHTVTYDGTNWNNPKSDILPAYAFAYTGEVNDIACSNGEWSYTPVLAEDQSDAEKLAVADVMIATGEASKEATLDLNFEHYYTKVTFNVELASEFDPIDKVTALTVSCGPHDVKAFIGEATAEVIIEPRIYTAGDLFATVTVSGDTTLTVNVPEGLTFEAGTHYTFNLKVGKNKVEIETVTVNGNFPGGWDNEVNLNADAGVTVGNPDAGKSAWETGDFIVVDFTSSKYGNNMRGVKYSNNVWTGTLFPGSNALSYLENETPTVNAIYSPYYTIGELGDVVAGSLDNSDSVKKGECEFIKIGCTLSGKTITADFSNVTRNYSRLRIVAKSHKQLTVTATGFTPAGATEAGEHTYTLTTDNNGNAFLYGVFAEGATVSVKLGDVVLKEYAFTAEKLPGGTEQGKSYVLDAMPVIDGTLGGKTTANEEDLTAMVELLRSYIENGHTTIIVTGSQPAKLLKDGYLIPVVSLAFEQLTYDYLNENIDSYWGTVDLIYQDVTEIVEYEFYCCDVLKSITLPKVTTVGDSDFWACYYLETLTFGSVVTNINDNSGEVFYDLGYKVGGCNLVLNAEQANAATEYQPNVETKTWWNTEWKSITLE